jgi:uncharacterized membrane protein YvbJ
MPICNNCGEPVQPEQTFCKNCGTKLSASTMSNLSLGTNTEIQTRNNIKKNASIPTYLKWGVPAVLVLAIALFGIHTYLSNLYKPEKTVAKFEQAVKQKDYNTLRKILTQDGVSIDLSDHDLASYLSFLTKDKDLNSIVNELNRNAGSLQLVNKLNPVTDNSGNNLLDLERGSKLLGIYQQYVINVYPFTIKAQSNADNTDIYLNEKKTKTIKKSTDTVTIGKFLPGDYTLKALYKGEFVSLNAQKKVDFSSTENNAVITKVDLNGHFVSISSNGDGAEIYANGKNTGKKVGQIDTFGPVPIDGSVELYAVLNRSGGQIKSAPVKITGDGDIYLDFKEIDNEQQQAATKQAVQDALNQYGSSYDSPQQKMQSFMQDYLSASIQAINSRDFSLVESYLDPNGKEYAESKNYIDYLATQGITESLLNETVLNVQSTDTGFKVQTKEEYDIYYNDGSTKDKTFNSTYTVVGDTSGLKIETLNGTNQIASTAN